MHLFWDNMQSMCMHIFWRDTWNRTLNKFTQKLYYCLYLFLLLFVYRHFEADEARWLRVGFNGFMDHLGLVVDTIRQFGPPVPDKE